MRLRLRREQKDKRVVEIEPSVPLNSHQQKQESAPVKGICPTSSKSCEFYPAENKDTVEDILELPLAQWIPSQHRRKSRNTSVNEHRSPGSVVWAKKAQMWWPAEVMITPAPYPGSEFAEGPYFVQFYGTGECALVDPARDLSPFEECFKERSCNRSEMFQAALKQAKRKRKNEQPSLAEQVIVSSEGHASCSKEPNGLDMVRLAYGTDEE